MKKKEDIQLANEVVFRLATEQDLERIVEMLADDKLGATREQFVLPLPEVYREAFRAIDADPNNELIVACLGNEVIGVQQITYTPYLTRQGGWRATIEGVRTIFNCTRKRDRNGADQRGNPTGQTSGLPPHSANYG